MRSPEAPPSRPVDPSLKRKFAAATFAFLFGAATGCEKIDQGAPVPERSQSMLEQIKREGASKTVESVVSLALIPHGDLTPEPAVEFSTLRITGDYQGLNNAGRLNTVAETNYAIVAFTRASNQVDYIVAHADSASESTLEMRRVQLHYRFTRTVVRNPHLPTTDAAARTTVLAQQVIVRPVGERLTERGPGPLLQEIHHTADTYGAALGQALYTLARPTEADVDATMHREQAASIQQGIRFQGELCGPITSPGMTDSIYCVRQINHQTNVFIDDIRQETTPDGLIRVSVLYHSDPNAPATPGR